MARRSRRSGLRPGWGASSRTSSSRAGAGGVRSSYSCRASLAGPRRTPGATTLITRTALPSAMVSTSPGLMAAAGFVQCPPLMRTRPAETASAASVRLLKKRACQRYLSTRDKAHFWNLSCASAANGESGSTTKGFSFRLGRSCCGCRDCPGCCEPGLSDAGLPRRS